MIRTVGYAVLWGLGASIGWHVGTMAAEFVHCAVLRVRDR